ncbi:Tumor necrosis factor (ligand) super, member [Desmophyllum pertusum]|uniref:Tumor necrosis factor (Ligand) super, member n=1 Tax=Desmophyllum pertusum TaxID=174260 RepID=A0A9X0CXP1_9CNID|nr:Tumor necrosis factor (ligand) super, member [Desmophyllum pertusum]
MATVQMKFVLIFALLAYTTGKQSVSATSCNPIVNVYGNQGGIQDPNKPSAHIEAVNKHAVTYRANNVIKDWSVSAPFSHLAGGMKYQDGKLTVPTPGRYYIYAQLYYHSSGRVHVEVNHKPITMIQPLTSGGGNGALYAGGVFNLKAGDVIMLRAIKYPSTTKIYMWSYHSYFGAYLI